jgi:hypothetical protein
LKKDVKSVVEKVAPRNPYLGLFSGGVTSGKSMFLIVTLLPTTLSDMREPRYLNKNRNTNHREASEANKIFKIY